MASSDMTQQRMPKRAAVRGLGTVLGLLAACVLGGCAAAIIPSDARINRDKIASVTEWEQVSVEGNNAQVYAWDRTALIIQGADGLLETPAENTRSPGRHISFTPTLHGKVVKRASAGAAAAISADGYWLTAAHCTDPEPLMIVHVRRDGTLDHWPARLVWRGTVDGITNTKDLPAESDIALLHTPVSAEIPAFTLAPVAPQRGRVLCLGSGVGTNAWSAGRITGVGGPVEGDITLIRHNAPVSFGDSGGPAMLDDGLLVGVNVERAWGFLAEDESTAVWIKPQTLRDMMDADRRARGQDPSTPAKTVAQPAEASNDAGL